MTARQRVYAALDDGHDGVIARRRRMASVAIVLLGLAAVCIDSLDGLTAGQRAATSAVIALVAFVFLVEYAARLWAAPERARAEPVPARTARLRWAVSASGVVHLVAVVPALALLSGGTRLGVDPAAGFALLWVLKLAVVTPGVGLIGRVAWNERRPIGAVLALFVVVLMTAATLAYLAEAPVQPEAFGSIPAALWWAIVTLTSTGYGDVVPQTFAGRVVGGGVMVSGVAVLALLAGILATGFASEMKRREFVRIWELVARVPFFSGLGALAISDVAARLRARDYPARAVVLRRGTPGDAMYFIAAGEVEVRLGPRPVTLRDGAFFGEMALLDRRPRSADVVTVTACTLLVLHATDFYEIAGRQPALVAAIEAEAKRRQAANRAAAAASA